MTQLQLACAVVGIGLVGAAATRHLAEAGLSVAGIGPLEPPDWASHNGAFSSHYDSGRITRMLDERLEWAELARRSILGYQSLTTKTGIRFHQPVGVLEACSGLDRIGNLRSVGDQLGVAYEQHEGPQIAEPYYQLPDDRVILHEPAPAGFINPRALVEAQRTAAIEAGATLVHAEVAEWVASQTGVELSLRDGRTLVADSILIAAGAYTRRLLPQLSFTVKAEITILAEVENPPDAMPALLYDIDHPGLDSVYVVPPTLYPDGRHYIKLGANAATDQFPADEAAMSEWMRSDAIEVHRPIFQDVLRAIVPGLSPANVVMKPCLVTYTTHGLPYVDRIGDRVVVAAGGNGQAAKSADALGALAAGLVTNREWTDALSPEAFRAT